jgi:diguanylate cyclase (GGDEF)-like protein
MSAGEGRHICCTMTSCLVRLVRVEAGEIGLNEVFDRAGWTEGSAYLENNENWVTLDMAMGLLEAGVEVLNDPTLPRRVGAESVRQHAGSPVATLLRGLGSPEAILGAITTAAGKFTTVTEMEATEVRPGFSIVRSSAKPPFTRHPLMCEWAQGLLSQPTVLFGLPPARVEELECQAKGADACVYALSWDAELAAAAQDPEQRATALEAQLAALSQRLQSVYATAGDLVSANDLDTLLTRIVERTASEVRATGYVLAVTPEPGADLQIYSHGMSEDDARALAERLAAGAEKRDSVLAVDVVTSRHEYGRLVAVSQEGVDFFAQERDLLALYAKHAAAVLDMATSLRDSARRHEQVNALLQLAHALARAGTSAEIATRLAEAVEAVVDCDAAAVWLWDSVDECMRLTARQGEAQNTAKLAEVTIRPADTPLLEPLVDGGEPTYFDRSVEDPWLQGLMDMLGLEGITVVPIIAREGALGLLTVSAATRPERLRITPELRERLTGVAAFAATAMQNGRFVDALDHSASHDPLTGALNRTGFGRAMRVALDQSGECVGLLYVDLDGFKEVNDQYGHDCGDDVLVESAKRLAALLRRDDCVARLGGDEFAIVVPGADSDGLAAAAERVRRAFDDSFDLAVRTVSVRASVGTALWPRDGETVEALMRHADRAMYREKSAAKAAVANGR